MFEMTETLTDVVLKVRERHDRARDNRGNDETDSQENLTGRRSDNSKTRDYQLPEPQSVNRRT